jgi:predicted P-loop ATPase/GTPase
MLEYVYMKLINGDDILSYKIDETPTTIKLSKPIAIKNAITRDGNIKPTASAYCGLSNGNVIDVFKTSCIFVSDLRPEAKSYYSALAEQYYKAIDDSIDTPEETHKPKVKSVTISDSIDTKEQVSKDKPKLH